MGDYVIHTAQLNGLSDRMGGFQKLANDVWLVLKCVEITLADNVCVEVNCLP